MITEQESSVTVASKENLPQTLSPDFTITPLRTVREVNTPIVPKKPSEDGYNWRKYGQKNVKGNEYIRSYYKCSYPNCCVKKQIERSHDGRTTDVTYLGDHNHAKPHAEPEGSVPSTPPPRVKLLDYPPSAVHEDKPSNEQSMDVCETAIVALTDDTMPVLVTPFSHRRDERGENLTPKRRKKGADGADITLEKPGQESRVVVQTVSEVDIVNDGYRWRKYGQKMVKGNPNPRSYYRCSTAGCPVKKHVERAAYDSKVVITTYEGEHDHTVPLGRTIVPQTLVPCSGGIESNGDGKSKSEERHAAQGPTPLCITYPTDHTSEQGGIESNGGGISHAAQDPIPLCTTYPTDHTSEDKHTPAMVVKIENDKSKSDHDLGHDSTGKIKDTPEIVVKNDNESASTDHNVGSGRTDKVRNTPEMVLKNENENPSSDHNVSHKSTNGDNSNRLTEGTDSTNKAIVEEEKGSPPSPVQVNITPKVSSTELKGTDETNSNGLQMPGPEPVNC